MTNLIIKYPNLFAILCFLLFCLLFILIVLLKEWLEKRTRHFKIMVKINELLKNNKILENIFDFSFRILFLFLILSTLYLPLYFANILKKKTAIPLEKHFDEYTLTDYKSQNGDEAYIKNKIVIIGRGVWHLDKGMEKYSSPKDKLDDLFYLLPRELRAESHEDVGTVIWIECDRTIVASYTGGSVAAQIGCKLSLFDFTDRKKLSVKVFSGSIPSTPSTRTRIGTGQGGFQDFYGSAPTEEMLDYIKNLPRRRIREDKK